MAKFSPRAAKSMIRSELAALEAAQMLDCDTCFSPSAIDNVYQAPCNHKYCQECLEQFVQHRVQHNLFPIVCCQETLDLEEVMPYLTVSTRLALEARIIEMSTPDKTYCHNPACSKFVPPLAHSDGAATCTDCHSVTCVECKTAAHEGMCPLDTETPLLLSTAKTAGWQTCYQCRNLVERVDGCNHMK